MPVVLAVFNWPKGSDRYRRIERFAERLFTKWDQFLVPPRHPKWRDVNLGATVPGWTRHIIAAQMLERFHGPSLSAQDDISSDFQAFLNRVGTGAPQNQADREALFRQFLQWREQQRNAKTVMLPLKDETCLGCASPSAVLRCTVGAAGGPREAFVGMAKEEHKEWRCIPIDRLSLVGWPPWPCFV